MAQPVSAVSPASEIVRDEIIALFAGSRDPMRSPADVFVGMDLLEIAQDIQKRTTPDDDLDLQRISAAVPV
jgi:hypothetical protein